MNDLEFHQVQLDTINYAWDVQGLDPIGSSDMLTDWANFIRTQVATDKYETPEKSWDIFAVQVLEPVYGIKLEKKDDNAI